MESTTMNPPVIAESRVKSEVKSIVFPVFVITESSNNMSAEEEAKSFKRRLTDTRRRFDQAWVCGNSILVAKISYELDDLEREAKEKGFAF